MNKMIATRDAFGDEILELGRVNDKLYIIDCDIGKSTKTAKFSTEFPQRHLNVGIAEQNAAGVAAGLSTMGMLPIISTYAVFGSMRMCEQVRTSICYPNLNVKIVCSHGGLTPGNDGATHQGIEDIGIYRSIPNMAVIMPADYHSARKLVRKMIDYNGPVYLRLTRDPIPVFYREDEDFEIGKGKRIREGKDISIITLGDMLHQALDASKHLIEMGIDVEIIDMHTVKPLDIGLIKQTIQKTGRVITVEDHNVLNGLGSAVAEIMAETGEGGVLRRIGLKDRFGESGDYYKLLEKYEMDSSSIIKATKKIL